MTKYVTKDALITPLAKGEHWILASKGLKKGEKLASYRGQEAQLKSMRIKWDFVNDDHSVKIKTIKEGEENELLHLLGI